jgi:hypothetical protein
VKLGYFSLSVNPSLTISLVSERRSSDVSSVKLSDNQSPAMSTRNHSELEKLIKGHATALLRVDAAAERAEQNFTNNRKILETLVANSSNTSHSNNHSAPNSDAVNSSSRNDRLYRIGNIKFPKFSGEEANDWIYRCEHFITIDDTPQNFKAKYAAIHLERNALKWHQSYMKSRNASSVTEFTWNEYAMVVMSRFSATLFEDAMGSLARTVQEGELEDYNQLFDSRLPKVNICEEYAGEFVS